MPPALTGQCAAYALSVRVLKSISLSGSVGDTGAQCGLRSAITMMVRFGTRPWQPANGFDVLDFLQHSGGNTWV